MKRFTVRWILLLVAVACSVRQLDAGVADDDSRLLAGVVKVDITPDQPVKMSGYASRKELSTGVHDPLSARVVALQQGDQRLVLVSTDIIGYYRTYEPMRDAICQRYDLQPGQLFLSAIHTHSAPTPTLDEEDGHPHNVQYTQKLQTTLIEAIGRAWADLQPVECSVARGHSPVGCNRREKRPDGTIKLGRNPGGPTDQEVLVMNLVKPDGAPVAVLFDYATHATSLGPRNMQISGDVLGLAAQFVEKNLGPQVTAPVFAGASGDIDPWYRVLPAFDTSDGWVAEPELLGMMLGVEVVHVSRDMKSTMSAHEIKSRLMSLDLPAKRDQSSPDAPSTKSLNVTVARVGDVAFVGLGCELLTEIGMAIKAGSPCEHTFVITHCNGSAGYLPPKHLYEQGGYEVDRSGFAPEAAEMLVKETLQALSQLK